MAVRIIPRLIRGRLLFEVGPVLFPTFATAAAAWSAAECHRLDIAECAEAMELRLQRKQRAQSVSDAVTQAVPLRRCADCQLDLGTRPGVTLRAAFACPLFGKPRAGVESRCAAFVAKAGAR